MIKIRKSLSLALAAVHIMGCAVMLPASAEASSGEVVVSADMLTDTQHRYTLIVDGVEVPLAEGTYSNAELVETEAYGQFGSSSQGETSDYAYRTALYITADGIDQGRSVTELIRNGSFSDTEAEGISIHSTSDSFTGVIIDGGTYSIAGAEISMLSGSDGSDVNDFTGLGTAIINSGGTLTLKDSSISTTGVAKLAFLTDNGAATLVENSEIRVEGGTLYDGYKNNSNMATMVAPPWVLGIGGNARLSNIEGKYSVLAVADSKVTSGGWGVLSTDSGSDMQIVTVDSEITLAQYDGNAAGDPYLDEYGTGYGVFAIGQAQEFFYGSTINAGTYGGVITGGYMTFADSNFENGGLNVYKLSGDSETYDFIGHDVTGFASEASFEGITGKGQTTTLNSDGFGIMTWGSAGILLTEGTVFNTDEAAFLVKSPDTSILIEDGSQVNADNGILLQMIDDENNAVGTDGTQTFNTEFTETAGWPSENRGVTGSDGAGYVTFSMTDTSLQGDLYNGTGYRGEQARSLVVNIGQGATLEGDICATETIHVNENYDGTNALACQNTTITSNQYYYIGRVANRGYFNGNNYVQVSVENGGVWRPTEASLITYLTVAEGGSVYAEISDNGDGTCTLTPSDELLPAGTYGEPNELVQVSGGFSFGGDMGGFDPSMMGDFDPAQMGGFDPSQMGGFDPSQMDGFGPSGAGSFDPSQTEGFGPSGAGSFDPSQMGGPAPGKMGG